MAEAPKDKEAAPQKKKPTMLLIIVGAVLMLGAGGGGAWFFMKNKAPPDPAALAEAQRKHDMKSRVFVPLDVFTVNLADENEPRLAQVGLVLEVKDAGVAEEIKTLMPSIRSRVLMILSAKLAKDLLSPEGKDQLALQIGDATAVLLGLSAEQGKGQHEDKSTSDSASESPIRVNFAQFLVQ